MRAAASSQPLPASAARELFGWWRSELAAWVGTKTRANTSAEEGDIADLIVVRQGVLLGPARAGPFDVYDLATGMMVDAFGRKWLPRSVAVTLGDGRFLRRKLADHRVPLERAQKMAELDIETQTPFKREDIYIFFAERAVDEWDTYYYLIRRDILDPVLSALDANQRKLGRLVFGDGAQVREARRYAVSALSRHNRHLQGIARHALALIGVILVGFAAYNVSTALASALSSVDSRIESLEPKAKMAQATFKERTARLERIEAVRSEQRSYVPAVRLVDELTFILPDTTYLTSLSIRPGKVKVTGFSKDAAALIPVIDGSTRFRNPRFVSAVVKAPDRNGEQFDLEVEVDNVR